MQLKSIRCIWFGFRRVDPSSYARACFLTPMRSGTWRLAPSTNAFSLPSSPLVLNWFPCFFYPNCLLFLLPMCSFLYRHFASCHIVDCMVWFCYSFRIANFNWSGKLLMELGRTSLFVNVGIVEQNMAKFLLFILRSRENLCGWRACPLFTCFPSFFTSFSATVVSCGFILL